MKKFAALMLTTAALSISTAPAFAGEREGAFSISPFVGGYSFDGIQHLETAPVYGLRLGYDLTKNWGMELVGDYLETEPTHSSLSINALSYRMDILYNFMADGPLVPYIAAGGGGITRGHGRDGLKMNDGTTSGTINAGGGIKYFLTDSMALRGDARQLFVYEDPNPAHYNWEYTVGLTFLLGGKKEAAPAPVQPPAPTSSLAVVPGSVTKGETAKLSWASQNTTNCNINPNIGSVNPQGSMTITPSADTDYTLSCSGQGGSTSSTASLKVTQPAVLDTDGDGVPDNLDKCPNTPKGVNVDKDGCPLDSDKDGVADYLDKCPNTPTGVKVDTVGCPFDTDKDGVLDYLDKCPNTPAGDKVDANGCTIPVELPCESVRLMIEFDTNKADIKNVYHDELKKVGDRLNKYPNATTVIEGHTDNVGADAANMKLSERRAASVRKYIIDKFGINADRLTAKGYGETKPVVTNKTVDGRKENRRVDAVLNCGGK